ncbi:MAG: HisS family protein [Chlamydiota bacterium]
MTALSSIPKKKQSQHVEEEFGETVQVKQGQRPNYTVQNPLASISGFTNYNATEMRVITEWKKILGENYRLHGFTGIETRPVEYADNLLKKGGMAKQIYGVSRLQDGSLTKLGIPFDRTLPLAIFIAQHETTITFPYVRFDIGYAFRGEHASKGRYRAFIQADNDIIDRKLTDRSDAQCIVTMIKGIQLLGVKKCVLFLNHIEVAKAYIQAAGVSKENFEQALRVIDKLKPDNLEEVVKELTETVPELNEEDAETLLNQMSYRGKITDFEFPEDMDQTAKKGFEHLKEICKQAELMGIAPGVIQFCPGLVRGLDYYTGVVFETFIPGKEKYGSIASGGRYSNLVDGFSTKKTQLEGVGASIGLTRLFDVMKEEGAVDLKRQTSAQVFVGYRTLGEGCYEKAIEVANHLQKLGIYVELYSSNKIQVGTQLELCKNKGIPFAIMVMNKDELLFKDMTTSTIDQLTKDDLKTKNKEQLKELVKKDQLAFKGLDDLILHVKGLKQMGEFEVSNMAPEEKKEEKKEEKQIGKKK